MDSDHAESTFSPPERRHELRRTSDHPQLRMLTLAEVMAVCAIGRTSIYDGVSRGQFPHPVQVLTRAPRWVNYDVQTWLALRIKASRRPM